MPDVGYSVVPIGVRVVFRFHYPLHPMQVGAFFHCLMRAHHLPNNPNLEHVGNRQHTPAISACTTASHAPTHARAAHRTRVIESSH